MNVSLTDAQREMLARIAEKGYANISAKTRPTAKVLERLGLARIDDDHRARHIASKVITTEDGSKVGIGSRVFNYYDMKPGTISKLDSDGWFDLTHDDGTSGFLNGERICTIQTARAKGWK